MGDARPSGTTEIVPNEHYEQLRQRVIIPDTKSKTRKWLTAQIQERLSKLESYKGQIASLEGMIEVAEDELKELRSRADRLEQLK